MANRKGSLRSLLRPSTPMGVPAAYSHQNAFAFESRLSDGQCYSNTATTSRPFVQPRLRLGSYNESQSYSENDDVFVHSPR